MSTTTSTTSSSTGPVTLSGFFSGLDTETILSKLQAADEIPINNLQSENATLGSQYSAYTTIGSALTSLLDSLSALQDATTFHANTATASDTTIGTASADDTASNGSVTVNITQVATNSSLTSGNGTTGISSVPAGTTTLSNVAGMTVASGDTFTINGKTITLTGSEVIDDGNPTSTNSIIGEINNSGAGVTASYSATTGKFTITSNTSSNVILGSGSDTSNFLQEAQLFNNGTTSVTSSLGIGRTSTTAALSSAGLATTPTTGTFYVNGVAISYNSGDSLSTVLSNITNSSAGVVATYDNYTDRITLTASSRGSQGITVTDGTSNLGSALNLTSTTSTFTQGKNTLFTVGNDTTVRQSTSATLSSSELGITGVSFTAIAKGTTTITVAPDTTTIAAAINKFVTQYNTTQTTITNYTDVNTSDPTQNGILAGDSTIAFLASDLRGIFSYVDGSTTSVKMLSDLGIDTNSSDNSITTVDSTKLSDALTNHLGDIINFFTDSTTGVVAKLTSTINIYNDATTGSITQHETNLKDQETINNTQITAMEAQVTAEIDQMRSEFADMESATAQNNSILSTLSNLSTG